MQVVTSKKLTCIWLKDILYNWFDGYLFFNLPWRDTDVRVNTRLSIILIVNAGGRCGNLWYQTCPGVNLRTHIKDSVLVVGPGNWIWGSKIYCVNRLYDIFLFCRVSLFSSKKSLTSIYQYDCINIDDLSTLNKIFFSFNSL